MDGSGCAFSESVWREESVCVVFDGVEAAFGFDPCTVCFVAPWLAVRGVARRRCQTLILGPVPAWQGRRALCAFSAGWIELASGLCVR